MTDSKPLSTFTERRVSRRRLLSIGAAVPAAVVVAKALPGRTSTSAAPQTPSATSAGAAAFAASSGPAYFFC